MVRNSGGVVSGGVVVPDLGMWHTREVNGAVVVGIDLVDHVLELRLAGILAERAHDGAKFLGGDLTCITTWSVLYSEWHTMGAGLVQRPNGTWGRLADTLHSGACWCRPRAAASSRRCMRRRMNSIRGALLTIAVLVLQREAALVLLTCLARLQAAARHSSLTTVGTALTNRENASLNSETCSSVRESA